MNIILGYSDIDGAVFMRLLNQLFMLIFTANIRIQLFKIQFSRMNFTKTNKNSGKHKTSFVNIIHIKNRITQRFVLLNNYHKNILSNINGIQLAL